MTEVIRPPTPVGGWGRPWPDVAELAAAVPPAAWTLIGGLMVQRTPSPRVSRWCGPRTTSTSCCTSRPVGAAPGQVATALEALRYRLEPSIDPRSGTAHRFVRDGAAVDLGTSQPDRSVVDVVAADHAPPRRLERLRGYDLVRVTGGTQALRRTVLAELEITGTARTAISVPDPFGALILKAAAHKADARDRERHLTDAAVLLACVDPFEKRTTSGSDRSRLLHLRAHLADPTAPAWLPLPAEARRNGQAALDLLCG